MRFLKALGAKAQLGLFLIIGFSSAVAHSEILDCNQAVGAAKTPAELSQALDQFLRSHSKEWKAEHNFYLRSLLRNEQIRDSFLKTSQGKAILQAISIGKPEDLLRLSTHPQLRKFYSELVQRLDEMHGIYSRPDVAEAWEKFEDWQKEIFLQTIAVKKLSLVSDKVYSSEGPYFQPDPTVETPEEKEAPSANQEQASKLPPLPEKAGKSLYERFTECLGEIPKAKGAKIALSNHIRRFLVTEFTTVVGFLQGRGGRDLDWSALPIDLIINGLTSLSKTFFVQNKVLGNKNLTWLVLYYRGLAFDEAKAGLLDGLFYYYAPIKKDNFGYSSELDAAKFRGLYSASWNVPTSPFFPTVFRALDLYQCVFDHWSTWWVTLGIDLAYGTVNSTLFYESRNMTAHDASGAQINFFPFVKWRIRDFGMQHADFDVIAPWGEWHLETNQRH